MQQKQDAVWFWNGWVNCIADNSESQHQINWIIVFLLWLTAEAGNMHLKHRSLIQLILLQIFSLPSRTITQSFFFYVRQTQCDAWHVTCTLPMTSKTACRQSFVVTRHQTFSSKLDLINIQNEFQIKNWWLTKSSSTTSIQLIECDLDFGSILCQWIFWETKSFDLFV